MAERGLDKKKVIAELTKSAHGDLTAYLAMGRAAALEDPEFFSHLIAWNKLHGQVRDSHIALPVIALAAMQSRTVTDDGYGPLPLEAGYADNALAHLAGLAPHELRRVFLDTTRKIKGKTAKDAKTVAVAPFAKTAGAPKRLLRRLVTRYLRNLEADRGRFEYTAVQHRRTLHELYTRYHVACPAWVSSILFTRGKHKTVPPAYGIFYAIRNLALMTPEEAAGTIAKFKIPFLVAHGALGAKAKDPDTVLALIKSMSPTELVTNVKWLESMGVKTNPALRAAFELGLGKAATAKTAKATLKTTRAAEAMADDPALAAKLHALQEKQLDKLGGVEGDWLVLADKSGSMSVAIEAGRQIAALLARMVKGKVHLIFFDTAPRYVDATGKTYEQLKALTARITADGGTSIGCGLQYCMDNGIHVDGIAVITDGGENTMPYFPSTYKKYAAKFDVEPTVYMYQLAGDVNVYAKNCQAQDIDVQVFDVRVNSDYYSLPNLVPTMRVSRYALLDDVMATPLLTLDGVLTRTTGMAVLPKGQPVTA